MKIGIVSIHSAHNYGSVLQAYALQESLKKFSDIVEIINYRPNYFDCQYKIFSIKIYKRYVGLYDKILHFGWRIIMLPSRIEKYNKFESFIRSNMNLTKKFNTYKELCNTKFSYDSIFVGSDQVWNTDITEGFDKTFYLGFVDNNTIKASYAASIGRKNLDSKYMDLYKKFINDFDFISLREKSSIKLLEKITQKKISTSLDPTLLLDQNEWNLISNKSILNLKNKKYIFVYILQENPEFILIVNEISAILHLPVYSISQKKRFNNEKIYPNAGPEDFLKLCENCEFVITNSFHGTVFSLIFEKRNCIIPHLNTGDRMIDLMKKVGLADRIVPKKKNLNCEKIIEDIDYIKVKNIIKKEQKKSMEYIKEVCKKGE